MPRTRSATLSQPGGKRPPKNANRSVGVGLTVLKALADIGHAATLSEISKAANMPASRTHRFLAGMIQVDAVRQDPASGRYDLGPMLVNLGVAALGRIDGIKLGTEALRDLTERTGLVSVLAIWSPNGPTVIRWEQGELATAIRIREGRTLSLLRTGCGKVYLAYLPEEKTRMLVDRELASAAHKASPSRVTSRADVAALADRVRRDGIADNQGESDAGIIGLAAPVFGADGEIVMAIAVIGVIGVADFGFDSAAARHLREAAAGISHGLGAPMGLVGAAAVGA